MDMSLSKLREMAKDGEVWHTAVHAVSGSDMTDWLSNSSGPVPFVPLPRGDLIRDWEIHPEPAPSLHSKWSHAIPEPDISDLQRLVVSVCSLLYSRATEVVQFPWYETLGLSVGPRQLYVCVWCIEKLTYVFWSVSTWSFSQRRIELEMIEKWVEPWAQAADWRLESKTGSPFPVNLWCRTGVWEF